MQTGHPNTALTPHGRLKMVRLVINDGRTIEATADKFQVDAKTVTKWRGRFLAEGIDGLFDRSSRPKSSPNQTPLDDRTRIIYSEIHSNEQAVAAVGFWKRASKFFETLGIAVERVITDNGSCYRSRLRRSALNSVGITPKSTRPYRPQTDGMVERCHRILLEEWAYIRDWHSDKERRTHYEHFYNHH